MGVNKIPPPPNPAPEGRGENEGRQLARAEMALKEGREFVQD